MLRRLFAELTIADRERRGSDFTDVRAWPDRIAGFEDLAFLFSSTIFPTAPGQTLGVVNTSFGAVGGRLRQGVPPIVAPTGLTPQQLTQPVAFSTKLFPAYNLPVRLQNGC